MKNFTAVKLSKQQAKYLEDHPEADTVGLALDKVNKEEKNPLSISIYPAAASLEI